MSRRGFSLIEVVAVLVVMSVCAAIGSRSFTTFQDSQKFKETVQALETMRVKMLGDPLILQSGQRADFGYWGNYGDVLPDSGSSTLTDIVQTDGWWLSPNPYISVSDAWGNAYAYTGNSTSRLITSDASLRSSASPFDQDIQLRIFTDRMTTDLRVFCVDRRGTLLIGGAHIASVTVLQTDGTSTSLAWNNIGYWSATDIKAGPLVIRVAPNGDPWTSELCGRASADEVSYLETYAVMYPCVSNVFCARFPGEVESSLP